MRRWMLSAGLLLAVVSGTAAAHSDVTFGFSFGAPGAVYGAPPAYYDYRYAQPYYYAAPRAYYGERDWDRHAYHEWVEHRRHEEREHWRHRDGDRGRW